MASTPPSPRTRAPCRLQLAAAAEYGASPEMVRHYHTLASDKHAAAAAAAAAGAAAEDLRHHNLYGSAQLPAELVEEDAETCRTASMPGAQGSLDDFVAALKGATAEYHATVREAHRIAQARPAVRGARRGGGAHVCANSPTGSRAGRDGQLRRCHGRRGHGSAGEPP